MLGKTFLRIIMTVAAVAGVVGVLVVGSGCNSSPTSSTVTTVPGTMWEISGTFTASMLDTYVVSGSSYEHKAFKIVDTRITPQVSLTCRYQSDTSANAVWFDYGPAVRNGYLFIGDSINIGCRYIVIGQTP